jgi:predicted  nucleic acid-binding Zn-ribbon protein
MDITEIKRLMRWSDRQRPEIVALLVKAEQAEQGWATASSACNRVADERDRLTTELTTAKEEIERLEKEMETATATAEANIHASVADGGTSCHWCMEKTRKEAQYKGRMEALDGVFQINGPSRAIVRLRKKYNEELQGQ